MKFINKTALDNFEFLSLTSTIPTTTSLMDLMVWGKKKNIQVLDLVKLDEYTFDVILGTIPISRKILEVVLEEKLFLVPDVT